MEQDPTHIRYLLHATNSWEPRHKLSEISFYSNSFLQRRNKVKRKAKLLLGKKRKDGGIKQFACEFCSKVFRANSLLIRHTTTHTGEQPFNCPTCNKSFSHKKNQCKYYQLCISIMRDI